MLVPQYLWFVCPLVALGAFTQGFTGLGFGIVIMAGVVFTPWDFERSTVMVNLLVLLLHACVIYTSWREARIQWRLVGLILVGLAIGVPLGYGFIILYGNQPVFQLVFGVSFTGFVLLEIIKPRLTAMSRFWAVPAGLAGGLIGGAFTTSGPPIAIFLYSQAKNPAVLKGTLQAVFMAATLWRLMNVVLLGPGISAEILQTTAICAIIVLAFALVGHKLSRRVSSRLFLRLVYIIIAVSGLTNIYLACA